MEYGKINSVRDILNRYSDRLDAIKTPRRSPRRNREITSIRDIIDIHFGERKGPKRVEKRCKEADPPESIPSFFLSKVPKRKKPKKAKRKRKPVDKRVKDGTFPDYYPRMIEAGSCFDNPLLTMIEEEDEREREIL
jgi:hypothetical protein